MLKFSWNGIKEDTGRLQLCSYHMGALQHHPAGTITIYGKRYRPFSEGVQRAFVGDDETVSAPPKHPPEMQSDSLVNACIRVLPTHALYAQVLAACEAKRMHDEQRWKRQAVKLQQFLTYRRTAREASS